MNEILVIGISHRTAPVEMRERLSFCSSRADSPFTGILSRPEVSGVVFLSTCNRVESYASTDRLSECSETLIQHLCRESLAPTEKLTPLLYLFSGTQAVEHLFRVSASLDSMVPGEPQISGQVKQAYLASLYAGAVDPLINHLFQRAFSVAKRIRRETGIGRLAISVSSVAVDFIRRSLPDFPRKRVILIGAGEMAEQAALALDKAGVQDIRITNRTHARSVELASRIGGQAFEYEDLPRLIPEADIIISSTFAIHYLLTAAALAPQLRRRKRPLFILDISVPRSVDPEIGNLKSVTLADIDRLQELGAENLKARMEEARKAEILIYRETEKFRSWQSERSAAPLISALHARAEEIRRREISRTLKKCRNGQGISEERIDRLTRALVKELLLSPTRVLREQVQKNGRSQLLKTFQKLFELELSRESRTQERE